MRCDICGRSMSNAEMWKLAGDRDAPTSRSMRTLCWDCRTKAAQGEETATPPPPQVGAAGRERQSDESPPRRARVA
jgi:hypothetical protein